MTELKKVNCSMIFLLPLFKIDKDKIKELGIVNTYLDDIDRDIRYDNSLYVLFKPEEIAKMQDFLAGEAERTDLIVDDYDYDGGYVIVVYLIPKEYEEDYSLFLEGKYSKMSDKFKDAIPKVTKIISQSGLHKDEITLAWRIFKKDNDLKEYWEKKLGMIFSKDMEVWERPDTQAEILDIEEVRKSEAKNKVK